MPDADSEHADEPPEDGAPPEEPSPESTDAEGAGDASQRPDADGTVDLKGIFRQLTAPMIESFDSRLREQVEQHVDEMLGAKVDAAIADRLSTIDRAIAHLSRALEELEHRVALIESSGDDLL